MKLEVAPATKLHVESNQRRNGPNALVLRNPAGGASTSFIHPIVIQSEVLNLHFFGVEDICEILIYFEVRHPLCVEMLKL